MQRRRTVDVAAKRGRNRALLDASFGTLRRLIGEKAESARSPSVDVEAKYSSRECSRCGTIAAKSPRRRRLECIGRGFGLHADVNAALVIRRRAQLALSSETISGRGRRSPHTMWGVPHTAKPVPARDKRVQRAQSPAAVTGKAAR